MKCCSKCGQQIVDEAVVCPHCGCAVASNKRVDPNDADSLGLIWLGLFVPLAGLIIFLVNMETAPRKARSAGVGALVGVVICIVSCIAAYYIAS